MFEEIRELFAIHAENGFSQEEVEDACKKYGGLPETLKQYYLQLGKYIPLNQQQNRLLEPGKLIDAGAYLIFYVENQYVAQWALKKSDIASTNPPVYCAADEKTFKLECENLDGFLLAMANFQAASWGLPFSSEDIYYLDGDGLSQITANYMKKPCELRQWIPISFYGNHGDEVICVMAGDQLLYASSKEEHFKELDRFVGQMALKTF